MKGDPAYDWVTDATLKKHTEAAEAFDRALGPVGSVNRMFVTHEWDIFVQLYGISAGAFETKYEEILETMQASLGELVAVQTRFGNMHLASLQ